MEYYGQEVPEALIAPDLQELESAIWVAFWDLSSDRQIGMDIGPIPWHSIKAYADTFGMPSDIFCRVVRAMDKFFMRRRKELQEKEKKK